MKLQPTGVKHTNKQWQMSFVLHAKLSCTLFIMQCCQKHFKQTFILTRDHIILALLVSLHITTLTLASVPTCHPASYGPLSRPQAIHRGTLITNCRLQALQAVGPKLMRDVRLFLNRSILMHQSVYKEQATNGIQQGAYLGEQRIMRKASNFKKEHTVRMLVDTEIKQKTVSTV